MPQYITVDNQRVKSEDALLDYVNANKRRVDDAKSFMQYWAGVNPTDAIFVGLITAILDGEEEVNGSGQVLEGSVPVAGAS